MNKKQPNIIIIVPDAVRAQNLPFYGYGRNTTPFLFSIKKDLAVYENAVSSTYWTMPSVASLFTGMYTSSHGLVADGDRLDKSLTTLPALLQQQGYRTAGFVRNIYVSEYSGLNSGFDDFVSEYGWDSVKKVASVFSKKLVSRLQPPGITRADAGPSEQQNSRKKSVTDIIARCFDVLIDRGSGKFFQEFESWMKVRESTPFFAYFHIFETHSPYRTPMGFALNFLSLYDNCKKLFVNHDHLEFLLGNAPMKPEHFQILQSAYDNSLRYADHIIEKIFRLLKKRGILDDTMVVILADHGDNIGDHGMMFHYFCLYDTLIKIPLLIKYPKGAGMQGRIPDVVQNVDVYPTILSLLNIQDGSVRRQAEGNDLLGRSLHEREKDLAVSELVKVFGPDRIRYKSQLERFNRRLLSVRTRDRKFIYSSRGDHECYNLAKDLAESNNVYGRDEGFSDLESKAYGYYKKMDAFYTANIEKIDGTVDLNEVDEATAEKLKALGYM